MFYPYFGYTLGTLGTLWVHSGYTFFNINRAPDTVIVWGVTGIKAGSAGQGLGIGSTGDGQAVQRIGAALGPARSV